MAIGYKVFSNVHISRKLRRKFSVLVNLEDEIRTVKPKVQLIEVRAD